MANKIGRNEQCPCGSGKKYKHCCFKRGVKYAKFPPKHTIQEYSSPREFFKSYHNIDLVTTIAALSIYPPNHGKNLRLEYLEIEALASDIGSQEVVAIKSLNEYFDSEFDHHHLEDPPGNLFTENVIHTLGNNIVYGGNFEQGAFTLNALISAVHFNKESLSKGFYELFNGALLILLTMSNLVATKLGHSRNLYGDHEKSDNKILFPRNIDKYKNALFFKREWFDEFCEKLNIDQGIISYFCIGEDRNFAKNEVANPENPLITKPIAELTNVILLVSPTSIVSSLIHFAWVQSERFGDKEKLIKMFHQNVWDEVLFYSNKIRFKAEDFQFKENGDLPVRTALFRFDSNKVACLSFIFDQGDGYDIKTPCHSDPMSKIKEIQELQDENFKLIKNKFKNHEFIDINLYSTIGREYRLMFPERDVRHSFISSAYKFLCWIKSESHNSMSLWYFLESKKKFENSLQFRMPVDFLDYCNLYRDNQSFYLGDNQKPNGFVLIDGGMNIIRDAIEKEDKIVAYHKVENINHPILIPVRKYGDFTNRYFNIDSIAQQLEFYLPGHPIDIWVRARNKRQEISSKDFQLYWEFTEAISYWFWQTKELLFPHLRPLNLSTLLISFELLDIDLFDSLERMGNKDISSKDKFVFSIERDSIILKIPGEICGYISASDNEGERIILEQLLNGLGKLLEKNGLKNTLDSNEITRIVNERIPLGLKKMLLFINTRNSVALDPRNVKSPTLIQESRKQWYMDEVVPLLGDKCPKEGEIKGIDAKQKLARNIALALLQELRRLLQDYNSKELLIELMKSYESIIHENALTRFRTPTRLHCFEDDEDIVAEIQKKTELTDSTSLSIRCLIEHLASESSFGNLPLNQQIIDDSIALMSLIIFWGSVGDQIRYELFNVELSVLPSQRIGTNSGQIVKQFFQKFSENRTKKYIEEAVDNFQSYFIDDDGKNNVAREGFNNAFANLIGIRVDKLGGIISLLIDIAFEQNTNLAQLTLDKTIEEVKKSFDEPFTDDEINAAIRFLSLWNRGDVTKVPEGFKSIDISPWRYNRKLSYLQRPLILVDYEEGKDNPIIYWTPRHLEYSWNFLSHLFMSGKYRAEEKSELERQISILTKKRGEIVQKEVINWFSEKVGCIIHEEVEISPAGKFKSPTNLGDCDVFIIDHDNKAIYSIECKRTSPAKNSKEMVVEVEHYFGNGSKRGYFDRHNGRHSWLESNIDKIGQVYNFDSKGYKVVSFFVTYEILSIQFMQNRPLPLPLISLFELKNMNYDDFLSFIQDF